MNKNIITTFGHYMYLINEMHIKIGNERAKVCFMNLIMCKFSKGNLVMCNVLNVVSNIWEQKSCTQNSKLLTEESHSKFQVRVTI